MGEIERYICIGMTLITEEVIVLYHFDFYLYEYPLT